MMIRSLTQDDASFMMHLQHQSTGTPWTFTTTQSLMNDPTIKGWGFWQNDTLLGFILIQVIAGSADMIEFVVDESSRYQGYGKKLYAFMEKDCSVQGVLEITLEVATDNKAAHLFYQRQGFIVVGLRPNYYQSSQGKIDALLMQKK